MARLPMMKRRADFIAARNGRTVRTSGFLLVRYDRGDGASARVGFTVTKKMGGAVTRNRIKRRFREAVRPHFQANAADGADYVMIASARAKQLPFAQLLDDVRQALLTLSKKPK